LVKLKLKTWSKFKCLSSLLLKSFPDVILVSRSKMSRKEFQAKKKLDFFQCYKYICTKSLHKRAFLLHHNRGGFLFHLSFLKNLIKLCNNGTSLPWEVEMDIPLGCQTSSIEGFFLNYSETNDWLHFDVSTTILKDWFEAFKIPLLLPFKSYIYLNSRIIFLITKFLLLTKHYFCEKCSLQCQLNFAVCIKSSLFK